MQNAKVTLDYTYLYIHVLRDDCMLCNYCIACGLRFPAGFGKTLNDVLKSKLSWLSQCTVVFTSVHRFSSTAFCTVKIIISACHIPGPYVGNYNIQYATASSNTNLRAGFSLSYLLLPC